MTTQTIDQIEVQPVAPETEQPERVTAVQPAPKKKKNIVQRVFDWFLNVFLVVGASSFIACTIVPALLGAQALTVLTGSMSPNIPVGHKVVNQPVDVETLKEGDVITYMPKDNRTNGIPIMHRVKKLIHENGKIVSVIVQGDANPVADPPVNPGQVTGKIIYTIPYAGIPSLMLNDILPQWTE